MTITVQRIIDKLIEPVGPFPEGDNTVDTLKSGDPGRQVSRAAVAMTATYEIIKAAVDRGAELLVVHEPTYFNHMDDTAWLASDPVFEAKRKLIEESGIAIFRFHDYMHTYKPDPIIRGVLRQAGWLQYAEPERIHMLTMPPSTVRSIATDLKQKLGIGSVLLIGDANAVVRRVCYMPGAPGGMRHMKMLRETDVELLIAGETNEWEANEYVRDAAALGMNKAMLVIGHHASEESGMREVVAYLESSFPGLPVEYLASPPAGSWI